MINVLQTSIRYGYQFKRWLVAGLFPIIIFFCFNPHYLRKNTFFWLALLTLPVSTQSVSNRPFPFFTIGIICSVLFFIFPATFWIYLILSFLILFLIQNLNGGLSSLTIVHISLISPLFIYVNSLVSFPIRLVLSQWVTVILQTIGHPAHLKGNVVYLGNDSFLIDEACAGLHMLGYGLLFGTLILANFAKHYEMGLGKILLSYALLITLIIVGNLVRITLLILFVIMPSHWFHEVLGWLIFLFQILTPFYLSLHLYTKYFHFKPILSIKKLPQTVKFPSIKYTLYISFFMLINFYYNSLSNKSISTNLNDINLIGYLNKTNSQGVAKFENEHSLIYIKKPVAAYKADHNPMICWEGSGYQFKKIELIESNGLKINLAELEKGEDQLYTSWWFESKKSQTGKQLTWRKKSLFNNEHFYLINLTSESKAELLEQLSHMLEQKIISSYFTPSLISKNEND